MKTKIYLLVFFAALALFSLSFMFKPDNILAIGDRTEIIFFDVGQGDASLIKTGDNKKILIDGGPGKTIINKLKSELAWWDNTIDLMILTHPHDDHVAGLVDVLDYYNVRQAAYTGVLHSGPNYLEWLRSIRDNNIPLLIVNDKNKIRFKDGSLLEVVYPSVDLVGKGSDNLNNTSIVIKYIKEESSVLLTGDIEKEVEDELSKGSKNLKAKILKVAHHGSNTSSNDDFLNKVEPVYGIISVGKNNKFNHPGRRAEKRLEDHGVKILRTDLLGDIKFVYMNGKWEISES